MIIGLVGKAGAGKDTAAAMLAEILKPQRVKDYKLAEPLKRFCKEVFNWTDEHVEGPLKDVLLEKGFTPRDALQTLGTDWARKHDPDVWVNLCLRKIFKDQNTAITECPGENPTRSHYLSRVDIATISDVRFRNEAEGILYHGGYLVGLTRTEQKSSTSNLSSTQVSRPLHASETSVEATMALCDVIIDNSDRDRGQLERGLRSFLEALESINQKAGHSASVYGNVTKR